MSLPRSVVVPGVIDELARFEALIRTIDASQWQTPTRCDGWVVADVCAHVVGTMADIAAARFADMVGPDATARQAAERKGRTPEELADELQAAAKVVADLAAVFDDAAWAGPPPVDVPGTLGDAVEAIWYDQVVHADDVRAALGRPSELGAGAHVAVSHVATILDQRGWGSLTLAFDGLDEFAVGDGSGRRIGGDPTDFILVATGRKDAAALDLDPSINIYA